MQKSIIIKRIKQAIGSFTVTGLLVFALPALAALTLAATSIVSDGALTLTGAGNSTWDIGANTLSIQTTGNGAVTFGSGAFTVGGAASFSSTLGVTSTSSLGSTTVTGLFRVPTQSASTTCAAGQKGQIYYDSDDNYFYGCNGSRWTIFSTTS